MNRSTYNTSNTLISIAGTSIQKISYKGEPVVTFAMVDEVHERPQGTASRNFREHRERFIEGEDYIELSSDEIRRDIENIAFSKKAPKGILLTRRGYLKLTKPMNDDRAWQVQGEMVDRYFVVEQLVKFGGLKSQTPAMVREARLQYKMFAGIAKTIGLDGNQAILSAATATKTLTGVDMLGAMQITHMDAANNNPDLTPTTVASRIGVNNPREVNHLLTMHGYQTMHRDHKGKPYYELTEKGLACGGIYKDTGKKHSNGTPVKQLMWSSQIVDCLMNDLTVEAAE